MQGRIDRGSEEGFPKVQADRHEYLVREVGEGHLHRVRDTTEDKNRCALQTGGIAFAMDR